MRRYIGKVSLTFAATLLVLGCTIKKEVNSMNNEKDILTVSASCKGANGCSYNGARELFIEVNIANVSEHDVGIPLEYVKKTGPSVALEDKKTGKKTYLKVNLADRSLKDKLTILHPNTSMAFEWVIFDSELKQFDSLHVDVLATVALPMTVSANNQLKYFIGKTVLHIVGQ